MAEKTFHCFVIALLTLTLLTTSVDSRAGDGTAGPASQEAALISELGFLTGFGYGKVREGDYMPVPLIVHLGMDMSRWFPAASQGRP